MKVDSWENKMYCLRTTIKLIFLFIYLYVIEQTRNKNKYTICNENVYDRLYGERGGGGGTSIQDWMA